MGPGDYVKVKVTGTGTGATQTPQVLKIALVNYISVSSIPLRKEPIAECLLPPYDDRGRYENWPLAQLEKVPPPDAKGDPCVT